MGEISLYLYDAMAQVSNDFVARQLPRLPAFRREYCTRYRQSSDQASCIIAYLLLAKGLGEQYDLPPPRTFVYGKTGKPFLANNPAYFNLSHCPKGVACALADTEIGVDIQDVQPFNPEVAKRVCSAEELHALSLSADPADLFCLMWTRKESYAKALGQSLAEVLRQDLPSTGFWSHRAPDYWVTTYCADAAK